MKINCFFIKTEVALLQKNISKLRYIAIYIILFFVVSTSSVSVHASGNFKYDTDYYSRLKGKDVELNVYNWGEYLSNGSNGSMDINKEFEKLTGIKINYSNYETNEAMYSKLKSDANIYDVIFPSDYMVARMIEENMLARLDFKNIPNFKYIDPVLLNPVYDKNNRYSIPYTWGITALIYNKKYYKSPPKSWKALWNKKYKNKILMFKNSRDAFAISLSILGYDINTEDPKQIKDAQELLKKQKPLLQAYVMDQIFDKMLREEAVIAPCYVGDGMIMKNENKDLEIALPEEHKNLFVDAVCVPKKSKNKIAAEMYINFLNEPEVSKENTKYILYSTPNLAAKELLPAKTKNNPLLYPDKKILSECESFTNLSHNTNLIMDKYWSQLMIPGNKLLSKIILTAIIIIMLSGYIFIKYKRKSSCCKTKTLI